MAHIARFVAKNYQCFQSVDIQPNASGLHFVVGPNNAGKSALLRALHLSFQAAGQSFPRSDFAVGPGRFEVEIGLDQKERLELLQIADEDQIDIDRTLQSPFCARLQLVRAENAQLERKTIHVSDQRGKFKNPKNFTQLRSPEPIVEELARRTFYFAANRAALSGPAKMVAQTQLNSDGENLANVCLHLMTMREADWERVRKIVADIVPDVGQLGIKADGDQCWIAFGESRPLTDVGTGTEQLLLCAVASIVTPPGSVLLIEEPESSLHPGAQRLLLEYLHEWAKDRVIICSTHSTVFLDRHADTPPKVWQVSRNSAGRSTVTENPTLGRELADLLGVRLSDVFGSEGLVVVEGEADKAILETWFGDELRRRRTVVEVASGTGPLYHADRVADWIDRLSPLPTQRLICIRDRDELSDATVERLEKKGVRVLPCREMENFLLDVDVLSEHLGLDAAEITAAMRAAADELKPKLITDRAMEILRGPLRRTTQMLEETGRQTPTSGEELAELLVAVRKDQAKSRAEIIAAWNEASNVVGRAWNKRWLEIAPGSKLLEAAFKHSKLGFRKKTSGPELAAKIERPEFLAEIFAVKDEDRNGQK